MISATTISVCYILLCAQRLLTKHLQCETWCVGMLDSSMTMVDDHLFRIGMMIGTECKDQTS